MFAGKASLFSYCDVLLDLAKNVAKVWVVGLNNNAITVAHKRRDTLPSVDLLNRASLCNTTGTDFGIVAVCHGSRAEDCASGQVYGICAQRRT